MEYILTYQPAIRHNSHHYTNRVRWKQKKLKADWWKVFLWGCDVEVFTGMAQALLILMLLKTTACSWCDLDTSDTTITDSQGYPHSVYISVTRDGSVWIRVGVDYMSDDWVYVDEHSKKLQVNILSPETISMLPLFNSTDYCVQTDVDLKVKMINGWHPSFIKTYTPSTKQSHILTFQNDGNCNKKTILSLASNKQGLVCTGGEIHSCGLRNLPRRDRVSNITFLRYMVFDPEGSDHYRCQQPKSTTSYTFLGSYYYAYIKIASCPPPTDSRMFGHRVKLRPESDADGNMVIIPDPIQTALASGVVIGWQLYAKIISFQHEVFLQVWRKNPVDSGRYILVSQTKFKPTSLRLMELAYTKREDYILLKKGDLLGLYFTQKNPIPYSKVPCASEDHRSLVMEDTPRTMEPGRAYRFARVPYGLNACRQYSFTAILANKTGTKLIEDWQCPNDPPADGHISKDYLLLESSHQASPESYRPTVPSQPVEDPKDPADMVLPIEYILAIIGGLLLLMTFIGGISYYRAIKS